MSGWPARRRRRGAAGGERPVRCRSARPPRPVVAGVSAVPRWLSRCSLVWCGVEGPVQGFVGFTRDADRAEPAEFVDEERAALQVAAAAGGGSRLVDGVLVEGGGVAHLVGGRFGEEEVL